ncbi:MAG: response regulator [Rhodoferax sp.]|uniref:response regulator n=1 Tax=Rhodoferax sp. TaxID=50421 RepID=UPI00262DB952|nr:response regulator [Rhodoferax sp.]MDD2881847.1 response regulator [Rhodoferax sp.]
MSPESVVVEKSFCTTREAATLLGVSVGTVQLWVESGLLQAWKTAGGHRRVMRASVDSLLHKAPQSVVAQTDNRLLTNQPRRLSVMVVEDDPALLRLYKANLTRWPMQPEVICVDNAVSALMMLGRGGPDLLIADLNMPGMDGFSMLRVLSKAPEMAQTTIVVVSGLDAAAIAVRGGLPEGIEVLSKPIPYDRLVDIAVGLVKQSSFQLPRL